jgi:two-component system, NtrC family, response regulator AtoC
MKQVLHLVLQMASRVHFLLKMASTRLRKNVGTEPIDVLPPDDVLFGRSEAMAAVRQRAAKVCHTNVPVLLYGDTGTGKEAIARWIHRHSENCEGQFVKVSCAAIPGALLESELFGYEKGAFTGARVTKPGRVELAHNGTLFLDEIADLDLSLQSKLLQFLQDGRFSRIGDGEERAVEPRLICATSKDLEQEIDRGRFRADLYYRIDVIRLKLPQLRQRREDIPSLVDYFLAQFQQEFEKTVEPLTKEMMRYLQNLDWPGNIRELSNGIARHVLVGTEASIAEEVPQARISSSFPSLANGGAIPLKAIRREAIRALEKNVILEALRANQWNRRKAAQELKISYRALIYKIRDAGLWRDPPVLQHPESETT